MKNPTSNGIDLYQVGNDYPQTPEKYFKLESYKDGIYTEVNSATVFNPAGEDADVFFDLKSKEGINKRILNVLPQSAWGEVDAEPASAFSGAYYLKDEYATAKVSADLGE